jgi:pectate lyase
VWLDHLSLSRFTDGLVDVTRGATDITVSWCLFRDHDTVMLIGGSVADVGDAEIRVTLHHNRFDGTNQRHPRLRYGRVHAFNNHFRRWGSYGMGISQRGQLRAERNIYEAGDNRSAVIHRVGDDPNDGLVRSVTEWRINNADVQENDRDDVFHPGDVYDFMVEEPNEALRDRIGNGVGWRDVPLP